MSYAGVEREYSRPCREGEHTHEMNGHCHKCGIQTTSKGYSIEYAELLKLREENKRLKEIEKRYNKEHEDDRYDPLS